MTQNSNCSFLTPSQLCDKITIADEEPRGVSGVRCGAT